MTSQIEQQASGLQGHLPECFMAARLGVDTYAPDVLTQMKRAGCICHRLRAREARALDAAINTVVTWQADRSLPPVTTLLAELNALRDQP